MEVSLALFWRAPVNEQGLPGSPYSASLVDTGCSWASGGLLPVPEHSHVGSLHSPQYLTVGSDIHAGVGVRRSSQCG